MIGFVLFFVITGLLTQWLNSEFNDTSSEFSTDDLQEASQTDTDTGTFSSAASLLSDIGSVLLSILKMATWSFGDLPVLLEILFFLPVRIAFWFMVIKSVVGGGS